MYVEEAGMTHIGNILAQVLLDVALRQAVAHLDHDGAGEFEVLSEVELSTPVGRTWNARACANKKGVN